MTLFSLVGRHDMGSLRVAWEFRHVIKRHRLFFDDGLDVYEESAIIRMFERVHRLGEVQFFTGFRHDDEESIDDLTKIINEVLEVQNTHGDVCINVTETLGTATAYLGSKLLPHGIKFVSYNPNEHEITILDQNGSTTHEADRTMSIKELFEFRGFVTDTECVREYLRANKEHLIKLFEKPKRFMNARANLLDSKRCNEKNELHDTLVSLSIIDETGRSLAKKMRLDGGLFEEFVGSLLADMPFDDVVCGMKVFWGGEDANFSNEFDALALYKNRLFVIECKMRTGINEEELLYKYDSVRRYTAPNAKAMVVHMDTKGEVERVSNALSARFRFNGIGFYSAKRIIEDEFKQFVDDVFFVSHASQILWPDSQAALAELLIESKNNCDEIPTITMVRKKVQIVSKAKDRPDEIKAPSTNGLVFVAEQKLPLIAVDSRVNMIQYYHTAMTNLLKQLAGWSHNCVPYSGYKDRVWKSIVSGDCTKCSKELQEAVANLKYNSTFKELVQIATIFFEIPVKMRDKTNPVFVELIGRVSRIYGSL